MQFCPKCGGILIPKKEGKKIIAVCPKCGYKSREVKETKLEEKRIKKEPEVGVVETEFEHLPVTEEECPKCGNKKAYYWLLQTRAGDEPETRFYKCTKCKHTWREY